MLGRSGILCIPFLKFYSVVITHGSSFHSYKDLKSLDSIWNEGCMVIPILQIVQGNDLHKASYSKQIHESNANLLVLSSVLFLFYQQNFNILSYTPLKV